VTGVQRAEPLNKPALVREFQQLLDDFRQRKHQADPEHIRKRAITDKDAAAGLRELIEKKGNIISINYTLIMQWLNFAILLLLLYGFFWDPVVQFLENRRKSIRDEIEKAGRNREQSEELLARRQKELARIKDERVQLIEQGRRLANMERERIRQQAREEAERIAREVREKLDEEVRRARTSLRREVAELASEIAEKILERELTRQDHDRIFEEVIEGLSPDDSGGVATERGEK